MSETSPDEPAGRRLKAWKEIAAFFGRDERTVRRWEATRGLPVRRTPGGARGSVFAYASELERWLATSGAEPSLDEPAGEAPPADHSPPIDRRGLLAGAGIGVAVSLAAFFAARAGWQLIAPPPAMPSSEIEELYARGIYLWDKRTPASLREARAVFEEVVARAPSFARGHAGLANTYNLLREYSIMPAPEAYAAAAASGREAVRLDPTDADAQCALAFAEFYGLRQIDSGLSRFVEALKLQPDAAQIHHWYGNALLHLGRFEEALAEVETAQRLDPGSRSIRSSRGLALFCVGRLDESTALLIELRDREPDYLAPLSYLAYVYLGRGDFADWLDVTERAGRLREDDSRIAVATAGKAGLANGGYRAMLAAMIDEEQRQLAAGRSLFYNLARLYALGGDGPDTLGTLRRSVEANEEMVMALNIDPAFRAVRTNPDFRRFVTGIGLPLA